MRNKAAEWLKDTLINIGIDEGTANILEQFITVTIIGIIAVTVNLILKYILIAFINTALNKLSISLEIRNHINRILNRVVNLILVILITTFLPAAFPPDSKLLVILTKICIIILIVLLVMILNIFLRIGYEIINKKKKYKQKPIKGFFQILQIINFCIGTTIIIAVVIDKSPSGLLTGLGAFAAVLSFILKDTILGFISGIQLSSNDMIKPGDWITVPDTLANGVVTDITLITIKVQNFDNTIVTVPTYSLITAPFQNWRGMEESGGRRIAVSLNIDMGTVKFCTLQEMEPLSNLMQLPINTDKPFTNLELYRIYLTSWLHNNPHINSSLLTMVRYLPPTTQGIPLQLYCFSKNKNWIIYEGVQAEILEHAIAIAPRFNLKIFQTLGILP